MSAAETTVVLADDHPLVLRGLVDLFSTEADLRVIGTAADGKAALELIVEKNPVLAVLDLVMPRLSGLDVLRELVLHGATSKVVFLSALISEQESIEAIGIGAWGILLKESAPQDLLECLRQVRSGKRWLPQSLFEAKSRSTDNQEGVMPDVLTSREWEIVNLVA